MEVTISPKYGIEFTSIFKISRINSTPLGISINKPTTAIIIGVVVLFFVSLTKYLSNIKHIPRKGIKYNIISIIGILDKNFINLFIFYLSRKLLFFVIIFSTDTCLIGNCIKKAFTNSLTTNTCVVSSCHTRIS